jgi:hypothetical protein
MGGVSLTVAHAESSAQQARMGSNGCRGIGILFIEN